MLDIIQQVHIKTHYLRLKVADALTRLTDSAGANTVPAIEELHTLLIKEIENVQEIEAGENLLSDENILVALEQDLGEALEKLNHGSMSYLRGRFIQYAHEHLYQRSASTGSRVRSTYATKGNQLMKENFKKELKTDKFNSTTSHEASFLGCIRPNI